MPIFDFLKSSKGKQKAPADDAPPQWEPAPERSHTLGLYSDSTDDEFEQAEQFCRDFPLQPPQLLSSETIERIQSAGCHVWGMAWPENPRFQGSIQRSGEKGGGSIVKVSTTRSCSDVCMMSDLPILGGLYEVQGKSGVYFEVQIHKMEGIIAIGTACKPYPSWRFPGWNRLSAGLHLDDMRKFFEDPNGGRNYSDSLRQLSPGDTVGCGYEFAYGSIFFTYNGMRLADAFTGIYLPRTQFDVFAAIGVEGECEFDVNFGGDVFRWKEGNEWAWRVEGHVGRLSGMSGAYAEELPSYEEARR